MTPRGDTVRIMRTDRCEDPVAGARRGRREGKVGPGERTMVQQEAFQMRTIGADGRGPRAGRSPAIAPFDRVWWRSGPHSDGSQEGEWPRP